MTETTPTIADAVTVAAVPIEVAQAAADTDADTDAESAEQPALEHALLEVRPGEEVAFEAAFATAKVLITRSPGFLSLRLDRCLERPHVYLLLVKWATVDAHVEGFRGGPDYPQWRALLHHFYDPMPLVEHFLAVQVA